MTSRPNDERLPFQVLVPLDDHAPIDVYEQSAALRLSVLDRAAVKSLGPDWDAPGVYILLDRHSPDGRWHAYVGKAPAGIRSRIRSHLSGKDHWYRAILIKRDTTHGFNSAHTAWLEGRLYDLLDAAALVDLHNAQRPGDDTLASYDLPMLESVVDPVSRLLRLIGHDPAAEPGHGLPVPAPSRGTRGKKARSGVTVSDLISAGLLSPGAELVSAWTTVKAEARVLPDGRIEFEGRAYPSPSAAGQAARGGGATNGWVMWAVVTPTGKVSLASLRSRFSATLPH